MESKLKIWDEGQTMTKESIDMQLYGQPPIQENMAKPINVNPIAKILLIYS